MNYKYCGCLGGSFLLTGIFKVSNAMVNGLGENAMFNCWCHPWYKDEFNFLVLVLVKRLIFINANGVGEMTSF